MGMAGEDRRPSTALAVNPFIEVTDTSASTLSPTSPQIEERDKRTPSPETTNEELMPWKTGSKTHRNRNITEAQYADTEVEELMAMLRETESLEEQGDILQYLVRFKYFLHIYICPKLMEIINTKINTTGGHTRFAL